MGSSHRIGLLRLCSQHHGLCNHCDVSSVLLRCWTNRCYRCVLPCLGRLAWRYVQFHFGHRSNGAREDLWPGVEVRGCCVYDLWHCGLFTAKCDASVRRGVGWLYHALPRYRRHLEALSPVLLDAAYAVVRPPEPEGDWPLGLLDSPCQRFAAHSRLSRVHRWTPPGGRLHYHSVPCHRRSVQHRYHSQCPGSRSHAAEHEPLRGRQCEDQYWQLANDSCRECHVPAPERSAATEGGWWPLGPLDRPVDAKVLHKCSHLRPRSGTRWQVQALGFPGLDRFGRQA
mmetsp:Transcript_91921/g.218964  ORF Transcript_91921/g.218964 Transcript_91921/m.218964 type:complete len:284 (+) Transcript_91921:1095-1946(+)